jgi:hypothetical protein
MTCSCIHHFGARALPVRSTYNEHKAELKIEGDKFRTIVLDESECDNLLRVYEYSQQPLSDLTEFFADTEGVKEHWAYQIAIHFADNAGALGKLIYA